MVIASRAAATRRPSPPARPRPAQQRSTSPTPPRCLAGRRPRPLPRARRSRTRPDGPLAPACGWSPVRCRFLSGAPVAERRSPRRRAAAARLEAVELGDHRCGPGEWCHGRRARPTARRGPAYPVGRPDTVGARRCPCSRGHRLGPSPEEGPVPQLNDGGREIAAHVVERASRPIPRGPRERPRRRLRSPQRARAEVVAPVGLCRRNGCDRHACLATSRRPVGTGDRSTRLTGLQSLGALASPLTGATRGPRRGGWQTSATVAPISSAPGVWMIRSSVKRLRPVAFLVGDPAPHRVAAEQVAMPTAMDRPWRPA